MDDPEKAARYREMQAELRRQDRSEEEEGEEVRPQRRAQEPGCLLPLGLMVVWLGGLYSSVLVAAWWGWPWGLGVLAVFLSLWMTLMSDPKKPLTALAAGWGEIAGNTLILTVVVGLVVIAPLLDYVAIEFVYPVLFVGFLLWHFSWFIIDRVTRTRYRKRK